MITKLFTLPRDIWTTYKLFEETIIEQVTVLEATYDRLGYKTLYYQTKSGSLYSWDREHPIVDLFETKQRAIDSVADGNYSIQ